MHAAVNSNSQDIDWEESAGAGCDTRISEVQSESIEALNEEFKVL